MGAGIAGLAAAWELVRAGMTVTVVDRATGTGQGTSGANGAQLSYAYVQPLADPSLWLQLPELLLARDSPLTLRLRLDPWQWAWGLRFLAACRASVSRRSTEALLQLAGESRAGFDAFLREERIACDFSATGKLVLYASEESFASARRQMALQRQLGSVQQALTPAQCVQVEPALQHYAPRIAGAIHTPGECAADCHKVCLELERVLRERGVQFLLGEQATALVEGGGRIAYVQTARGMRLQADAFLLALGTDSPALLRPLGLGAAWQVPVQALKGYSFTAPASALPSTAPRVNVTDAARKVVFARLGDRLRVAGMAELTHAQDWAIDPRRIASLQATAQDVFPGGGDYRAAQPWAGLRPATPTGTPVLGRLHGGPANLFASTGHGALGFTLAFGSAQRVAAQIARLGG
ncbi:MAG TPA: amino acid dehydrogenase [Comamonadaceae bacterium]|nr:amino acid dehydrogenase [Comamonadaceae bacterium]